MNESSREDELEKVILELDGPYAPRAGEQFIEALAHLREFAENGSIEAAKFFGELLAFPGPAHDPSEAYKWYYVGLSQSGYSVDFEDTGSGMPFYCGPVGDFRNESMVSDLVVELGIDKIHQLDREAASWMVAHKDRW